MGIVNPSEVMAAVELVRETMAKNEAADAMVRAAEEALVSAKQVRNAASQAFIDARNRLMAVALGPEWLIP